MIPLLRERCPIIISSSLLEKLSVDSHTNRAGADDPPQRTQQKLCRFAPDALRQSSLHGGCQDAPASTHYVKPAYRASLYEADGGIVRLPRRFSEMEVLRDLPFFLKQR